jgi:hypothetical protein
MEVQTEIINDIISSLNMNLETPGDRNQMHRLVHVSWMTNEQGCIPDVADMARVWVEHNGSEYSDVVSNEDLENIVSHCILEIKSYPSYSMIDGIVQCYLIHSTLPTEHQLSTYMNNMISFNDDSENFWQNNRCAKPTRNLHLLPVVLCDKKNEMCSLCQGDITVGTKVYEMKNCCHGHFHYNSDECLGTENILSWLKMERSCPLCGMEVKIVKTKN